MATKRKLKPRPTYRQHAEATIQATIKAAIPPGGVFFDYLTDIRLEPVVGATEYERGRAEGVREFAAQLQDVALSETPQAEG